MNSWSCLKTQRFTHGPYTVLPIEEAHIEPIRVWRNGQMDVLRQAEPISVDQQKAYYNKHIFPSMTQAQPANILVGFLHKETLIGYGGLVNIAWYHRRAEISFLLDTVRIHEEVKYARDFTAFLKLICNIAFKDLQLHRVFTETFSIRDHHISVLEAAGFRPEGLMREHVLINGKYYDSVFHGLINSYDE